MNKILHLLRTFISDLNVGLVAICMFALAIGIYVNYFAGGSRWLYAQQGLKGFLCWYLLFLSAFSLPYLLMLAGGRTQAFTDPLFIFLLLLAPAIFAGKMVISVQVSSSPTFDEDIYWSRVINWPLKLLSLCCILYFVSLLIPAKNFFGLTTKDLNLKPYLIMLLIMAVLISLAATQKDFLAMYPKFSKLGFLQQPNKGLHKLLYELAYGSDFIGIELFFRGFLIFAFVRWWGADAILPMAMFYCTIHFGKPMAECISSFFGGMLLGVIAYYTNSIVGGIFIHLGIAWLMELAAYISLRYFF